MMLILSIRNLKISTTAPQCKCLQIIPLSLWTNRRVQWQPDKREQMPPAPDFNPIHSIDPRLQHHLRLSSFNFKQMQTTWSYENLSPLNIIKWTFGSPQVMYFHVLLLNRELDVWAKICKSKCTKSIWKMKRIWKARKYRKNHHLANKLGFHLKVNPRKGSNV